MKKIDKSIIFSICATLIFISSIIVFGIGDNITVGFLLSTAGFLFLTLSLRFRRKEEEKAKEKKENESQ